MSTSTPPITVPRFPVQQQLDGDFTVDEIRPGPSPLSEQPGDISVAPEVARQALANRWWRLDQQGSPHQPYVPDRHGHDIDSTLLQAFETSRLWTPPVGLATRALAPQRAKEWLDLAAHWTAHALTVGDLRYLNVACKILGASWAQYRHALNNAHAHRAWNELSRPLTVVADSVGAATDDLLHQLVNRSDISTMRQETADFDAASLTPFRPGRSRPRLVVLAARGSRGAAQFLELAVQHDVNVTAVCWYESAATTDDQGSSYANAWYPPEEPWSPPSAVGRQEPATNAVFASWDVLGANLADLRPDLILLIGMPIVPASILCLARLGVVNAHNGALPHYRGMDAVAWALINDEPIVCTAHLATPKVDRGDVMTSVTVPFWPGPTLRTRVKTAQLFLLLAVCRYVAAEGHLPDTTPQPAASGRTYYRLHPVLRRVLDASPYGTSK